ncbi:unnamed protein product [Echinostoma caproni]|uniref:EGF-like domain-containing protein n=1 Tax=Echinostoma caproni TaxID=27848 RepID=A0A183AXV9_9TREM|nr:unnamed protein product [Echinostoma caproni]
MVYWILCTLCLMLCHAHATTLSNLSLFPSPPIDNNHALQELLLTREERHAPIPPGDDQSTAGGSATTLAFIEVIVKRTVNQYMKVIRTQPDWFERLLQLVREELNIRSKYNCSTDACIYKIQLFTHYLHSHLMGSRGRARKRVRRSAEFQPPSEAEFIQPSQLSENIPEAPIPVDTQEDDKPAESSIPATDPAPSIVMAEPTVLPDVVDPVLPVDDALRLPEIIPTSKSQNNSVARETLIHVVENDSSRPQASHFGTPDKINMVRVSQEVLSEALSKQQQQQQQQQKQDLSQANAENAVNMDANPSLPSDVHSSEILLENQINDANSADSASLDEDKESSLLNAEDSSIESVISNEDDGVEEVVDEETIPRQTEEPILTVLTTDSAATEAVLQTEIPVAPDIDSASLDHRSNEADLSSLSWNPGLESDSNSPLHLDMSVHAIPFGQNEFVGKPYENCTGRFENYCYNALKCVYISVLETAACYCRTGYTGVRCDMFNLPQTLDILKSFKEEIIDVPSLHQTNAITLYSVVEATA